MAEKHTPGPWRAGYTEDAAGEPMVVVRAEQTDGQPWVAVTVNRNGDRDADARLIAAAPAMHDALVNLLGALEQLELDKWPALAVEIDDALAALNDASPPRPPT